MWKLTFFLFLILGSLISIAQNGVEEIIKFQKNLNQQYQNPEESPLKKEDLDTFTALSFYPIDTSYRVTAKWIPLEKSKPFEMPTSTDRLPLYKAYGKAVFTLQGQSCTLTLYQNIAYSKKEAYANELFLPFMDLTNGEGSYSGGRYIDVKIPSTNTLLIDFNQSYNPYCAYNYRYSCPIPPKENRLKIAIPAGVKTWQNH